MIAGIGGNGGKEEANSRAVAPRGWKRAAYAPIDRSPLARRSHDENLDVVRRKLGYLVQDLSAPARRELRDAKRVERDGWAKLIRIDAVPSPKRWMKQTFGS